MTPMILLAAAVAAALVAFQVWAAFDRLRTRRMAEALIRHNRDVMRAKGIDPEETP